jgi:outer membrane receptor for ferric coprogen and ferric-rhodotorulic acid
MKLSFRKILLPAHAFAAALVLVSHSAVSVLAQNASGASLCDTEGSDLIALDKFEVNGAQMSASIPVLTTTRLALSVRETPQSISTISRLRLDQESIFSVNDALQNVTGVHVSFYDTQRPLYFARGFQITDFQVDGIPTYSGSTNQEYDTALYERIEVIRGANGLMSGAGIPSATVNLQRKRPSNRFAAFGRATTGSWDYYRGEADVNVPLAEDGRFRSRFVVAAQDRESFRDRYSEKKFAWLASVEGDVTATTVLGVGYQFQKNDPTSPMWGTLPRFAFDGSLLELPREKSFSTNWTEWDRESGTAFITLDQKLGDNWLFRAAYNRTEGDSFSLRVYATGLGTRNFFADRNTGAGLRLLAGIGETADVRDNLDLYTTGKIEFFGRQHDVVLGWNMNNLEATSPTYQSITGGAYFWQYVIADYRTFDGNAPRPALIKTGAKQIATTDQSGFYASLRYRAIDPLSVIVGARLSRWETKTNVYDTSGVYNRTTGAYEITHEVTPYVGAVYDIGKVWSAYASYTDVFRPQNNKNRNGDLLSPVLGTNIEGGLKAEFFAKRFQVSIGVFETKQDNYAVRDGTLKIPDGTADAYIGVDGTKSNGVELELSGYITPGWTANLGYSNINTRRHALDLTYANVPEHLIQFSTNYRFRGAWKRLSLGTSVNWQGKATGYGIDHPILGTATVEQSSFALVNIFTSYRFTDRLALSANIRNTLDHQYWATLDYANYGEPRNFTISLSWKY